MTRRTCGRFRDLLAAAADEGEPVDLALHRHVRGCLDCQCQLRRYRRMRTVLVGLDGDVAKHSSERGPKTPLYRRAVHSPRAIGMTASGAGAAVVAAALVTKAIRRHVVDAL